MEKYSSEELREIIKSYFKAQVIHFDDYVLVILKNTPPEDKPAQEE